MKTLNNFLTTATFVCFVSLYISPPLFASLMGENELNEHNYTAVHIWNDMWRGGRNFGHAALQIVENNISTLEVSLHPAKRNPDTVLSSVPADWHSLVQDGNSNTIVKLYSLNRAKIKAAFEYDKQHVMYTGGGNGDKWPFDSGQTCVRNCASEVRYLLNMGGMKDLFQTSLWNLPLAMPGAAAQFAGVGFGVGGGLIGGGLGFMKGLVSFQAPFNTAWVGCKKTSMSAAVLPYDLGTRAFSKINYGHRAGECLVVTPKDVKNLSEAARKNEKIRFANSRSWK